jgi:hypothetical protein
MIRDDLLGCYEICILSMELKRESGSQMSLVKESSLVTLNQENDKDLQI